jgi:hypothetical protein
LKETPGVEIKAEELLLVLKRLRPNLQSSDIIPVLSHFCFAGKFIHTYDDVSGMEIEMEVDSGLNCAVPGEPLLRFLSSVKGTVTVVPDPSGTAVDLLYGKSKVTMGTLTGDSFLFSPPDPEKDSPIACVDGKDSDTLTGLLADVVFSTGNNAQQPYTMGANLRFSKTGVSVFTTDGVTISYTEGKLRGLSEVPDLLIPSAFCGTITNMENPAICFYEGSISARDGTMVAVSRLPFPPSIDRIVSGIKQFAPKGAEGMFAVPPKVTSGGVVERCLAVTSADMQKRLTLDFKPGRLEVRAEGKFGKVFEVMKSESTEERSVVIDIATLKRALDNGLNQWNPTERCLVMGSGGTLTHLLYTYTESGS